MNRNGFTVAVLPRDSRCYVSVLDTEGNLLFEYHAPGIQAFVAEDLIGAHQPGVIIQADTYDPYTLFLVSLSGRLPAVRKIENQYGFWLQDDCQGLRLWTADGGFQADPDLADVYHKDLFLPEVVLALRGTGLIDTTPDCKSYFDDSVLFYRARLTTRELRNFRMGLIKDDFHRGQIKGYILKIVYSYLYSGREDRAREAVTEMWPLNDANRLWKSILEKRSKGILMRLADSGSR